MRPQDIGVAAGDRGSERGTVALRVHALAAGGRGVARHEGLVWLVDGALPGDWVRARAVRHRKRHVDGIAIEILEPGAARRSPPCPLQGACGGCPWMPLDEAFQREWKARLLREALVRIGRAAIPEPDPVRSPSAALGYRNRVEFGVRAGGGRLACIGLHGGSGRALVDVERCLLQHDSANAVLSSIREFLGSDRVRREPSFELRLAIRRAPAGQILVTLRENGPRAFRGGAPLARFLVERHPEVVGVVELRAAAGRRGGTRARALAGTDRLAERVGAFGIELPAASFAQVSDAGAAELLRLVGDLAMPVAGRAAVDLYGGVGLYGMELASRGAAEVTVCDADHDAITAGRAAAVAAGLPAVRHVHADAASFLGARSLARPEVLVANPPRTGLGPGVAGAIRALVPPRLILVSCDPATLARDLGLLARAGPYRVDRLVPVDLFPQTAHLETVALLTASTASGSGQAPGSVSARTGPQSTASGRRPRRRGGSRPRASGSG